MTSMTIDDYLTRIPEAQRAALEQLRSRISAAAPHASEAISYGLPAFRLDGRYFAGFGATTRGCSFYAGQAPVLAFADELAGYRTWKGTINFTPARPLPDVLVDKLVECRVTEFETYSELEPTR
jgi:uncharacterized protein YdhG (YjbR/CyaY superfamily)